MSILASRNIELKRTLGSYLATASGYKLVVRRVGGEVSAISSGTTISLRGGHNFRIGDKFFKNIDATVMRTVSTVGNNSITINSALTVAVDDTLFNLGDDTGSGTPNFAVTTSSTIPAIYSVMDGNSGKLYANSIVTTDSTGEITFYYGDSGAIWIMVCTSALVPVELLRDTTGAVVAGGRGYKVVLSEDSLPAGVTTNASGTRGVFIERSTTDGAAAHGIQWVRDGVVRWSMGEDYRTGGLQANRSYFALWSDLGTLGSPNDILAISWYGADASGAGTASPKWLFNSAFGADATYDIDHTFTFTSQGDSTKGGKTGNARFHVAEITGNHGGVEVGVSGTNYCLDLLQRATGDRSCYFRIGSATMSQYWLVGQDVSEGNTAANFQIQDAEGGTNDKDRLFISKTGLVAIGNGPQVSNPANAVNFCHQTATTNADVNIAQFRLDCSGTAANSLGSFAVWNIEDASGANQRGAAFGTKIVDAANATFKSSAQIYSSYGPTPIVTATATQRLGINKTNPATVLHIAKDASNACAITLEPSTSTPANPAASAEASIYIKAGVLVFQYNDAGTVEYLSIPLSGTGTTWTHNNTPI